MKVGDIVRIINENCFYYGFCGTVVEVHHIPGHCSVLHKTEWDGEPIDEYVTYEDQHLESALNGLEKLKKRYEEKI